MVRNMKNKQECIDTKDWTSLAKLMASEIHNKKRSAEIKANSDAGAYQRSKAIRMGWIK